MAVIGALLAGVPITPINPKAGSSELEHILERQRARARAHAARRRAAGREPRRGRPRGARSGDLPAEPAGGRARDRRLHVRHDRAAEGRGPAAARARLQPRRARRGVGVDRRRRRRPRAAAVPRARADPRHARAGAPRRRRGTTSAASRPRRSAAALADDATMLFARADDVPPARRRGRAGRRDRHGLRERAAARLRLGRAARRRPRTDREAHRPADRRALRHDRDADEHRACARPASGAPAIVGPPLDGVEVRLVGDDGDTIEDADDETIGEIHVRGPNLFLELPQPARRDRRGDAPTAGSRPATSRRARPTATSASSAAGRPT